MQQDGVSQNMLFNLEQDTRLEQHCCHLSQTALDRASANNFCPTLKSHLPYLLDTLSISRVAHLITMLYREMGTHHALQGDGYWRSSNTQLHTKPQATQCYSYNSSNYSGGNPLPLDTTHTMCFPTSGAPLPPLSLPRFRDLLTHSKLIQPSPTTPHSCSPLVFWTKISKHRGDFQSPPI